MGVSGQLHKEHERQTPHEASQCLGAQMDIFANEISCAEFPNFNLENAHCLLKRQNLLMQRQYCQCAAAYLGM